MKTPTLVWVVVAASFLYLGLRWFESAMLYFPSRVITAHPGSYGLPWEKVSLTATDGVRLSAWYMPGTREDGPVMLCLHGNGGNLSNRVEKMRIFHDAGAAQLWVEWRGYGESGGRPSEHGLYRDAEAARAWLAAVKGVGDARLVLYGESLGNGPAIESAASGHAAGLIVDSGFTSVPDMAALVLPWMPRVLVATRFDNLATLPRVRAPVLFLHSREDDVVPFEMARRNFAAANEPKRFVEMRGTHNDGFLDTGAAYGAAVREFLSSL